MLEKHNNKENFYAWILFFVWPFLSVISAFKNYKKPWAKNILWAFIAFYGFTFAIGIENESSDIVRYIDEYQQLHQVEMTLVSSKEYFDNSGEVDVLRTFIAITLSRFTDNASILTLFYGIIFGFFFSRNMWYVLNRFEGSIHPTTILLFICFFLIVPIWDMNGFRMWTAAHIFLYGLMPFVFEKKFKGLWISGLAVLVHFSFIIPVGILIVYAVFGNKLTVYFCFFVITLFLAEINLTSFNNLVEAYAPEMLQERTASYRGEEYVEEFRLGDSQEIAWYAVWYSKILSWAIMLYLSIMYLRHRKDIKQDVNYLSLFCFVLLFYGVANILGTLPSGSRFITVANLCAMVVVVLFIQKNEKVGVLKRSVWLTSPAILLFILVSLRIGIYSTSFFAIIGNPLLSLFVLEGNISLNDFMRSIL
jgi:hypothetical protein